VSPIRKRGAETRWRGIKGEFSGETNDPEKVTQISASYSLTEGTKVLRLETENQIDGKSPLKNVRGGDVHATLRSR